LSDENNGSYEARTWRKYGVRIEKRTNVNRTLQQHKLFLLNY